MRAKKLWTFLFLKKIPPLTDEEIAELDALKNREIDYSDIPPLTDEEIERFRANIRRKKS
ncbi:MAG: hypothetical protein IJU55_04585 [Selenomonadaceae bacterium]|nr:hypothetical protein [Selenomonadaceae bacterium]